MALNALPAGREYVVQPFLLGSHLFLLVRVLLLRAHLGQHAASVVCDLVALALIVAQLKEHFQCIHRILSRIDQRTHLLLQFTHTVGRRRLLERTIALRNAPIQLRGQLFESPLGSGHLELRSLQRELFAPLDTLADAQHRS